MAAMIWLPVIVVWLVIDGKQPREGNEGFTDEYARFQGKLSLVRDEDNRTLFRQTEFNDDTIVVNSDKTRAYLAVGRFTTRLYVVDIGSVVEPVILGEIAIEGFPSQLMLDQARRRIVLCLNDKLALIDLSDEKAPKLTSTLSLSGARLFTMSEDKKTVFVLQVFKGLSIVSIDEGGEMRLVGSAVTDSFLLPGPQSRIALKADRVEILNGEDSISVFDVRDYANPVFLGTTAQ